MSDATQIASPPVIIRAGRVVQQAPRNPIDGTVIPRTTAVHEPLRQVGSLADTDRLLLKARFMVSKDIDGSRTVHNVYIDRAQVGRMSSRALVMMLGRLTGYVATEKLFFVKGSIELADRSLLSFMDMAIAQRHAACANMITVEALLI
jgi:hypothetical protein